MSRSVAVAAIPVVTTATSLYAARWCLPLGSGSGGYGLTLAGGFRWSVSVSSRFLSRWFVWLVALTIRALRT